MRISGSEPQVPADTLERLIEFGQALASTREYPALLETILTAARTLTGSQAAAIVLLDSETGDLELQSASWQTSDTACPLSLPPQRSLAGRVVNNRGPIALTQNHLTASHFEEFSHAEHLTVLSALGAPLMLKNEPIGVIEVVNKTDGLQYTPGDAAALSALAAQAVVAIQSAVIFGELQRAADRIAEVNRTQADFLAIASHELRTPLEHILVQAVFLRDVASPELAGHIDNVIAYAGRLEKVVDELVNLDHIQQGRAVLHLEPFSLGGLLSELQSEYAEAARAKQVRLSWEQPSEPLTLNADREKIRLALAHLLDNAIKFSPEAGSVVVAAEALPEQVRISISNTGPVIPPEQLEHIFERFYQGERHNIRRHDGLGLGLPIVKGLVETHGGWIWAESTEAKGTCLTFVLPRTASGKAVLVSETHRPGTSSLWPAQPTISYAMSAPDPNHTPAFFDDIERQIQKLLDEGSVVRPAMLTPVPRREAETYLSRYALRHREETVLLSDYSLVRSPDYKLSTSTGAQPSATPVSVSPRAAPHSKPLSPAAADGSRPVIKPLPSRASVKKPEPVETADLNSASREAARPRIIVEGLNSSPETPSDSGQGGSFRGQAAILASIMMLLLALGYLSVVLLSKTTPSAGLSTLTQNSGGTQSTQAVQSPVPSATAAGSVGALAATATSAPLDATPTPTHTVTATPAPASTEEAVAATAAAEFKAGHVAETPITLDIRNLAAENSWTTCRPVDNQLGDPLGQVCLGMAGAYADATGQPLSVDGAPAIYAVWVRLDSFSAGSGPLMGFSTDPNTGTLPPELRTPAQIGSALTLAVGGWSAQVTVIDITTRTYPGAAPSSAPILTALQLQVRVTQP